MTPRDTLQRLLIEHRKAHDPASSEREIVRLFHESGGKAELWDCLIRNAEIGFHGAPSWRAVLVIPMLDSFDQTIHGLVTTLQRHKQEQQT